MLMDSERMRRVWLPGGKTMDAYPHNGPEKDEKQNKNRKATIGYEVDVRTMP
jgi:hypothetical protein